MVPMRLRKILTLCVSGTVCAFLVACGPLTDHFGFEEDRPAPQLAYIQGAKLGSGKTLRRIAFGSCADQNNPQGVWTSIEEAKPDAFIFMGDNVYGDVTSPDLRELVAAYNGLAASRPFTQFAKHVPVLAVWDDHDYGLNDGGADFQYRDQSKALFLQFWDVDHSDPRRDHEGIYRSWVSGDKGRRVQVILLDTRSFRSPLKKTDARGAPGKERYVPDADPGKTMLGAEQWAWLEEQLREPAELRLIVSSIQVLAEGHGWERWGNLPGERAKLFDVIERTRAEGVILLSGDRHLAAMYRDPRAVDYPLTEVTSSSLNLPIDGINGDEPGPLRLGPTVTEANFGLMEIDWDAGEVALTLRRTSGAEVQRQTVDISQLTFAD